MNGISQLYHCPPSTCHLEGLEIEAYPFENFSCVDSDQYHTLATDSNLPIFPAGYASDNNKTADRTAICTSRQTQATPLLFHFFFIRDGPSKTQLLTSHLRLPSQPTLTPRSNSSPTSLTPQITSPTSGTRNRHRRHRSRAIARYRRRPLHHTPLIRLDAGNALFETVELDGRFRCYGGCGTCWGGRCGC